MKNIKNVNLNTFLWLALGTVFLINIAVIMQNKSVVAQKKAEADELARPANISITIIKDSSCSGCADLTNYINAVKKQNVKIIKEEILDTFTANGGQAKIISKTRDEFNIQKIPTFIATGELTKFEDLKNLLNALGTIKNGAFVFTAVPPYVDYSKSGHIAGLAKLILISANSCKECYDVNIHKTILARLGLDKPSDITLIDRNDAEGKKLIRKYKITAVPTFVLTGEVVEYPGLINVWPKVGTIEKDGAYVFRKVELTGLTYFNLKTGKVVKPGAATPAPTPSPKPK